MKNLELIVKENEDLIRLGMLGVIVLVGLIFAVDALQGKKYMSPFYNEKASIVFGEGDLRRRIDDLSEITEFRMIIISSPEVSGHHSYPVDQIKFYFPDEPSKTYLLGKDSETAGEFWLEASALNGTIYLLRFQSERLAEWLTRNSVQVTAALQRVDGSKPAIHKL